DFGLSKVKASASKMTNVAGTLRWKSPEEFRGEAISGLRARACDVYSLGMVFWEVATRKTLPYAAYHDNTSVFLAVMNGKKETIPDDVPRGFAKIIRSCWSDDPEQRPRAVDLIITLERRELTDASALLGAGGDYYYGRNGRQKDYGKARELFERA